MPVARRTFWQGQFLGDIRERWRKQTVEPYDRQGHAGRGRRGVELVNSRTAGAIEQDVAGYAHP